jgi:hypothetical protein
MSTVTTEALERTGAALLQDLTALAADAPAWLQGEHQIFGPRRTDRVAGPGVQAHLARLQAAQAALALIQALLQDEPDINRLFDDLETTRRKLVAASRLGNGWLELRPVWRPQVRIVKDPATGKETLEVFRVAFGPYLYYRWKEGGRTRTAYLGKPEEAAGRLWKLKALGVDLHDLGAEDLITLASETSEAPNDTASDEELQG